MDIADQILTMLRRYSKTSDISWPVTLTVAACTYTLYYLIQVVHRPKLYVKSGKYEKRLRQSLPILQENYWPTFWAFSSHLQTVFRALLKSKPSIPYVR